MAENKYFFGRNLVQQDDMRETERVYDAFFGKNGTFPNVIEAYDELMNTPTASPEGFTEEQTKALLSTVTCSEACMKGFMSGSTAVGSKKVANTGITMLTSNALGGDRNDWKRQSALGKVFLAGRETVNACVEKEDHKELQKLFSDGVVNLVKNTREYNLSLDSNGSGPYAGYLLLEQAAQLMQAHPELVDPAIIDEQMMEEVQIAGHLAAYIRDTRGLAQRYEAHLEKGEPLSEDDLAALLVYQKAQLSDEKSYEQLEDYLGEEILKTLELPDGLPMPIGQRLDHLAAGIRTNDYRSMWFSREASGMAAEERGKGLTDEAFLPMARARLLHYPEGQRTLMEEIKKSGEFQKLKALQGKELDAVLQGAKPFTEEEQEKLLKQTGTRKMPYHYTNTAEIPPQNREYAEGLKAARSGVVLAEDPAWQERIQNENKVYDKLRNDLLNSDGGRLRQLNAILKEQAANCREFAALDTSEPPLDAFLHQYPGALSALDADGNLQPIVPKENESMETVRERVLDALQENRLLFKLPSAPERPAGFWLTKKRDDALAVHDLQELLDPQARARMNLITERPQEPRPVREPGWFTRAMHRFFGAYKKEMQEYRQAKEDYERKHARYLEDQKNYQASKQLVNAAQKLVVENEKELAAKRKAGDPACLLEEGRQQLNELDLKNKLNPYAKLIPRELWREPTAWVILHAVKDENDRQFLDEALGRKPLSNGTAARIKQSAAELLDRKHDKKPLLTKQELQTYQALLMNPKTGKRLCAVGACLLAQNRDKLEDALQEPVPSVVKDVLEYGELVQETAKACVEEGERALLDPNAKPDIENVKKMMATELLESSRLTSPKEWNDFKTTRLFYNLGELGRDDFLVETQGVMRREYGDKLALSSRELLHQRSNGTLLQRPARQEKIKAKAAEPQKAVAREVQKSK